MGFYGFLVKTGKFWEIAIIFMKGSPIRLRPFTPIMPDSIRQMTKHNGRFNSDRNLLLAKNLVFFEILGLKDDTNIGSWWSKSHRFSQFFKISYNSFCFLILVIFRSFPAREPVLWNIPVFRALDLLTCLGLILDSKIIGRGVIALTISIEGIFWQSKCIHLKTSFWVLANNPFLILLAPSVQGGGPKRER